MEIPQGRLGRKRAEKGPRRYWSKNEEIVCIGVVKDLIKGGWRSGNGWRGGFYKAVEEQMKSTIPDCTLTELHVNSKLTVWKREWVMVYDVASLSGVSWDHASNTILVDSDEVWASLQKNGTKVDKIRGISFPYYEDWCEIFGKDRATGENACDFATNDKKEAEKKGAEKISRSKGKDKVAGYDTYFTDCYYLQDEDGDSDVNIASPTVGGSSKRKKLEKSIAEDQLTTMMCSFLNDTKDALLGFNKSIDKLCDGNPNAARAMAALKNISSLSQVHRLEIAQKLVDKPMNLQLFVAMDADDQFGYVKKMLGGTI